ncbi:hypothetical protein ACTOB_002560 [Actinoplanes oblitus]|uniref:Uncharacterized protein n=1 Tax=Actinoplanes oblitus TaxID=3040509 RepID=A0ABY8WQU6_9ACTN|nr:hypothetical protein [Actinoplanes oblitus]WIM98938.1 hypothetical protein ACTOB_002560 [Actinoplanes oblitus]
MNKLMRGLAMSGFAVAAGLAISAGPATASSAAPQPAAKASANAHLRDRIIDFYRSPMACHRAGRIGEWRDRWEDHDCIPIRHGFRRGYWALKVYYGWGGDFHDRDHRFPGDFPDHDGPGHGPWQKN